MGISLTEQTFLYLLNCAVNEKIPETLSKEVDFEELYRLSKFHSVSAMVSYALDKGGYLTEAHMPAELVKKWASARIGAIRKNLMFDAEREQILQYMEAQGIWYMPLKGVILKEMYPDVGMREMCDNDILFDVTYRRQIRDYMVSRGYEAKEYGKYIDDAYLKKPYYNFEMHTRLFGEYHKGNWMEYYSEIKKRLCKDANKEYGYHFSDEDFYIYLSAHAYKHYRGNGTGVRTFVDTYVYLNKKKNSMNWNYIKQETAILGIDAYEKAVRRLVENLFASDKDFKGMMSMNEQEAEMISYVLCAGTYGNQKNKIRHDIKNVQADKEKISLREKLVYFVKRVCPGLDYMKLHQPFFYTHRYLIPFFWIYRLITRPFVNGRNLVKELRILMKLK